MKLPIWTKAVLAELGNDCNILGKDGSALCYDIGSGDDGVE